MQHAQLRKKTARAILLLHHKTLLFASLFILSDLAIHLCEDRFHDPCRGSFAVSQDVLCQGIDIRNFSGICFFDDFFYQLLRDLLYNIFHRDHSFRVCFWKIYFTIKESISVLFF